MLRARTFIAPPPSMDCGKVAGEPVSTTRLTSRSFWWMSARVPVPTIEPWTIFTLPLSTETSCCSPPSNLSASTFSGLSLSLSSARAEGAAQSRASTSAAQSARRLLLRGGTDLGIMAQGYRALEFEMLLLELRAHPGAAQYRARFRDRHRIVRLDPARASIRRQVLGRDRERRHRRIGLRLAPALARAGARRRPKLPRKGWRTARGPNASN